MKNFKIIFVNLIIVVVVVFTIIMYVFYQERTSYDKASSAFVASTQSMEDIVSSDLITHHSLCYTRENYINSNDMTLDEAMLYLKQSLTSDVTAQIVMLDTLEGLSTSPNVTNVRDYTVSYRDLDVIDFDKLSHDDSDADESVYMTKCYINPIDQKRVVSFCHMINIVDDEGNPKEAVLLRVVPVENLDSKWAFPTYYENATLALVSVDGDYVVKGGNFDGGNFYDFIGSGEIRDLITKNPSGAFTVGSGEDRIFYSFSRVRVADDWVVIGAIPVSEFKGGVTDWTVTLLIVIALGIALTIDFVYIKADIRQKEKTQEILRAALQQAEAANNAKSAFLSNMSHDIRTPMNGIIGMTAIAGAHLDDKERVADCLQKITVASKHLLGLINEVLDMSRIESGRVDLSEEDFNLSDLVDNLLTMIKPQIEEHKHELTVNIDNVTHEKVVGDSLRIQQVFMNLMSNAVKYTPDGGKIRLSVSEKPTQQKKMGLYEIRVEDNGIGMSKEYLEKIYEPFSRAEDGRTSKIQGTGLGMSIARNIVHMMGGEINVESELDKGSTFIVTFFLKLQEEEEASYEEFLDIPVLVADDDKGCCESACAVLDELGMKSEWVLSGREAVKLVRTRHEEENDFFAVIIDWKMPDMDGVATTRAIRQAIGEDIPIIIISAYDWSDIEQEARRAGANAFISKPLFKSRIINLFTELVDGARNNAEVEADTGLVEMSKLDLSGKRVLLAEDNELNAEIAKEILEMTGLSVEHAENGAKAVDCVAESKDGYFDLVLMDIQMPVMNGYEATRAIRAIDREYTKKLPIVAMTANAFAEDVLAAKGAGMDAHIAKPLEIDTLARVLNKWIA
jgi:signal transduction histidine kinase/CheY-like chemotaxis protein